MVWVCWKRDIAAIASTFAEVFAFNWQLCALLHSSALLLICSISITDKKSLRLMVFPSLFTSFPCAFFISNTYNMTLPAQVCSQSNWLWRSVELYLACPLSLDQPQLPVPAGLFWPSHVSDLPSVSVLATYRLGRSSLPQPLSDEMSFSLPCSHLAISEKQ